MDPLTLSVGIGLAVSLLFVEFFGLAAGGMVVPGYIALNLTHPVTVILTLLTGVATFLTVRGLSSLLIIFGRRRIALTVLIAFLFGALVRQIFATTLAPHNFDTVYTVVGFIIPGLIAISIDRQGILETVATLLTASAVVRLILIILIGPALSL
jgi:poly-gamma-glutamate biosynthesis protein PgsC/CapC